MDDLLVDPQGKSIQDSRSWETKVLKIREQINWGLGEEPPSVGPGRQSDYLHEVMGLPAVMPGIDREALSFGYLYYPKRDSVLDPNAKLPVVIYQHEYSYSTGIAKTGTIISDFVRSGFAVYVYDQLGFGSRLFEESRLFYDRFPQWSKMGRMVADVRWSVDALSDHKLIDHKKIFVAGYALGGTVAIYSAALDDRVAGIVSVSGFTPMRLDNPGKTAEGIYSYSHLHGLLPRLGFFAKNEDRIPYDFDEMLAAIAPRPVLVVAPTWDQYATFDDVQECVDEVRKVYDLYGRNEEVELFAPEDYNRFSDEMRAKVIEWLVRNK